ncbi:MAG: chorismate synthase [Candidatus Marinimicrobia bacterium]|nr:chorismate synthase [Candidatus Neomarinimicrobiota bacterium]
MKKLKFLTAGESHGKGLIGILDGLPAGLEIAEKYINQQLDRRQHGHGRGKRMEIEHDQVEIYSGVRFGKTLGSPIALTVKNRDWENWSRKMAVDGSGINVKKVTLPRPGHADLAGAQKFDFDDIRNVLERSSARETAMRVALASLVRKLLEEVNIDVGSRVIQIRQAKDESQLVEPLNLKKLTKQIDLSPVRCLSKNAEQAMLTAIDEAQAEGDSVGGVFEVLATGLPYGLGSYTHWDRKLSTRLSAAIMSINAIKGVEIGRGFALAESMGSQTHDEIMWNEANYHRATNNAGGLEGGMTNAQPLVLRAVMKPIPTLMKPLRSVDMLTKIDKSAHKERTDVCAVPAASIVAESMICLVLADALLEKFGGDTVDQLKNHMKMSARY